MAAKKGGKKSKKGGKKAAQVETEAVAAAPAAPAAAVKAPVAAAPASAPAPASTNGGSLVVTSKLREALRGHEVRMSGDLPEALNAEILAMLERAVERARENRRGTVRPSDL